MQDLIDRNELIEELNQAKFPCVLPSGIDYLEGIQTVVTRITGIINDAVKVEAEPVRHGRWESWGFVFHGIEWKRCSVCGKCADVSYYGILDGEIKMSTPALCGCCGAKMDTGGVIRCD